MSDDNNNRDSEGAKMSPKAILAIGLAAVVFIAVLVVAFGGFVGGDRDSAAGGGVAAASASDYGLEFGRPGDIVLGDPNAPVEMIEYASTTCGACAAFHLGVLPALKEKYIESGLLKYTVRELPTAPQALSVAAFMMARCVGEERYFNILDVVFQTQQYWVGVETLGQGRDRLAEIARQAGLSQSEFQECLSSEDALNRIRTVAEQGAEEFGVRGTPTIFINGERVPSFAFEDLDTAIIARLPDNKAPAAGLPEGWENAAGPAAGAGE